MTDPTRSPQPVGFCAWWLVAVLALAGVLSYADRQLLNLMVDHAKQELRLSDVQIGLLQGVAFALIYAVAGLPLGRLADRASRRWMIFGGIVVWSAATIACGYAESFAQLFAGRFFVGVGEAVLTPAAISLIADAFPPRRRGVAIGVYLMGMSVGGGVGLWAGGLLYRSAAGGMFNMLAPLAELAPWRVPFVLLGGAGMFFSMLLLTLREPPRLTEHDLHASGARPDLWRQRSTIVPFAIATALVAMSGFVTINWAPALLGRKFGLDPAEVGARLGPLLAVMGIVGSVGTGFLSDRIGSRGGARARLWLQLIIAAGACITGFASLSTSLPAYFWIFAAGTLLNNMSGLNAMTTLQDLVPARSRAFAASLLAFGNLSFGLGGGMVLAGAAIDRLGIESTDAAIAAVAAPAGLVAALLYRRLAARAPGTV